MSRRSSLRSGRPRNVLENRSYDKLRDKPNSSDWYVELNDTAKPGPSNVLINTSNVPDVTPGRRRNSKWYTHLDDTRRTSYKTRPSIKDASSSLSSVSSSSMNQELLTKAGGSLLNRKRKRLKSIDPDTYQNALDQEPIGKRQNRSRRSKVENDVDSTDESYSLTNVVPVAKKKRPFQKQKQKKVSTELAEGFQSVFDNSEKTATQKTVQEDIAHTLSEEDSPIIANSSRPGPLSRRKKRDGQSVNPLDYQAALEADRTSNASVPKVIDASASRGKSNQSKAENSGYSSDESNTLSDVLLKKKVPFQKQKQNRVSTGGFQSVFDNSEKTATQKTVQEDISDALSEEGSPIIANTSRPGPLTRRKKRDGQSVNPLDFQAVLEADRTSSASVPKDIDASASRGKSMLIKPGPLDSNKSSRSKAENSGDSTDETNMLSDVLLKKKVPFQKQKQKRVSTGGFQSVFDNSEKTATQKTVEEDIPEASSEEGSPIIANSSRPGPLSRRKKRDGQSVNPLDYQAVLEADRTSSASVPKDIDASASRGKSMHIKPGPLDSNKSSRSKAENSGDSTDETNTLSDALLKRKIPFQKQKQKRVSTELAEGFQSVFDNSEKTATQKTVQEDISDALSEEGSPIIANSSRPGPLTRRKKRDGQTVNPLDYQAVLEADETSNASVPKAINASASRGKSMLIKPGPLDSNKSSRSKAENSGDSTDETNTLSDVLLKKKVPFQKQKQKRVSTGGFQSVFDNSEKTATQKTVQEDIPEASSEEDSPIIANTSRPGPLTRRKKRDRQSVNPLDYQAALEADETSNASVPKAIDASASRGKSNQSKVENSGDSSDESNTLSNVLLKKKVPFQKQKQKRVSTGGFQSVFDNSEKTATQKTVQEDIPHASSGEDSPIIANSSRPGPLSRRKKRDGQSVNPLDFQAALEADRTSNASVPKDVDASAVRPNSSFNKPGPLSKKVQKDVSSSQSVSQPILDVERSLNASVRKSVDASAIRTSSTFNKPSPLSKKLNKTASINVPDLQTVSGAEGTTNISVHKSLATSGSGSNSTFTRPGPLSRTIKNDASFHPSVVPAVSDSERTLNLSVPKIIAASSLSSNATFTKPGTPYEKFPKEVPVPTALANSREAAKESSRERLVMDPDSSDSMSDFSRLKNDKKEETKTVTKRFEYNRLYNADEVDAYEFNPQASSTLNYPNTPKTMKSSSAANRVSSALELLPIVAVKRLSKEPLKTYRRVFRSREDSEPNAESDSSGENIPKSPAAQLTERRSLHTSVALDESVVIASRSAIVAQTLVDEGSENGMNKISTHNMVANNVVASANRSISSLASVSTLVNENINSVGNDADNLDKERTGFDERVSSPVKRVVKNPEYSEVVSGSIFTVLNRSDRAQVIGSRDQSLVVSTNRSISAPSDRASDVLGQNLSVVRAGSSLIVKELGSVADMQSEERNAGDKSEASVHDSAASVFESLDEDDLEEDDVNLLREDISARSNPLSPLTTRGENLSRSRYSAVRDRTDRVPDPSFPAAHAFGSLEPAGEVSGIPDLAADVATTSGVKRIRTSGRNESTAADRQPESRKKRTGQSWPHQSTASEWKPRPLAEMLAELEKRKPDPDRAKKREKHLEELKKTCGPFIASQRAQRPITNFFVPAPRPVISKVTKPKQPKRIHPDFMVNGKLYRPPRLARPSRWCTDKLYNVVNRKMKARYGELKMRRKSEKFVVALDYFVRAAVRCKKNFEPHVNEVKRLLYKLGIIKTSNDFYVFVEDFLPGDFRQQAIPIRRAFGVITGPKIPPNFNMFDELKF